jgi:1-acylglycerone phosphate reductase
MTGAVKGTNFHHNVSPTTLPENSYYPGVRDFIDGLGSGRLADKGISQKEFAAKVVREVEKGSTGKCWVGGGAMACRIGTWLLPESVWVRA